MTTASGALERRFEAIVLDWDAARAVDGHADAGRVRSLVEDGCALGLELGVISQTDVGDVDGQLGARPAGPGGLWLELNNGERAYRVDRDGPHLVYRAAAADAGRGDGRWIMGELWRRGIAPEQILVAGGEVGGLSVFAEVLDDQIARRRRGELPIVDPDPTWTLQIDGADPLLERVHESMLTIADGRLGTRGSVVIANPSDDPAVVVSGVYDRDGAESRLLAAPRWVPIGADGVAASPLRRILDLHGGVLHQELGPSEARLDALLFSSLARPATTVLRLFDRGKRVRPADALAAPVGLTAPLAITMEAGEVDGCAWVRVTGPRGSIAAALDQDVRDEPGARVVDRIAAYEGNPSGVADERAALRRLRQGSRLGFEGLLAEHRRTWAGRWEDADVQIEGDAELQLDVRLALFHLMATVGEGDEAAVGARGLSGAGYHGHVFWDSDVYVLPFLAATRPQAARAMLEYRVRRLPAALRAAHMQRRGGARFPWESAASGEDVTPSEAPGRGGEMAPVLTGTLEEHIVADVAWSTACYLDWSGDHRFATGPGLELLVQTARWWASRIEVDAGGHGHIRGVMGPDEYHPHVDDNAYTNVMARWNLRQAACAAAGKVEARERRRWLDLADRLVDGYDADTGVYEQFAGFHALEPLVIAEVAPQRPVAADVLLGSARTRAAQVVKQADVLMLHYLVPGETPPGSLAANLDFYEPRTAHGSSLSPGVHAALLARARRPDQALEWLRRTARIDLDDISQTTAGGLHLAAMGSVWGAVALGFTGLRPAGDALAIDPLLAPGWNALELRTRFRSSRVRVRVTPDGAEVSADPPVTLLTPDGERREASVTPTAVEPFHAPGGTSA